jgi:membrane protein insertase Oxa1/YidC/SpoIIIJ
MKEIDIGGNSKTKKCKTNHFKSGLNFYRRKKMNELSPELQDINDKRKKLDDLFERMIKALNKSIERNKL